MRWGKRTLGNSKVGVILKGGLKLDLEKNHASRFVSHSLFNVSLDSVYPHFYPNIQWCSRDEIG